MKKYGIFLLALLLIFTLCACGQTETAQDSAYSTVGDVLADGYENRLTTVLEDGTWAAVYEKNGDYLKVTAALSEKEQEEYEALFFEEEEKSAFENVLEITLCENITDQIPTDEELGRYVGKTLGELEDEGLENIGYSGSDTSYTFFFAADRYEVEIGLGEDAVIESMDDLSANDLRAFVAASATFSCFTTGIFE